MRVWLICVVAFFGIAEIYQWVQAQVQGLPLPVYGAAGLLLAVASNADRWRHLRPIRPSAQPDPIQPKPTPVEASVQPVL